MEYFRFREIAVFLALLSLSAIGFTQEPAKPAPAPAATTAAKPMDSYKSAKLGMTGAEIKKELGDPEVIQGFGKPREIWHYYQHGGLVIIFDDYLVSRFIDEKTYQVLFPGKQSANLKEHDRKDVSSGKSLVAVTATTADAPIEKTPPPPPAPAPAMKVELQEMTIPEEEALFLEQGTWRLRETSELYKGNDAGRDQVLNILDGTLEKLRKEKFKNGGRWSVFRAQWYNFSLKVNMWEGDLIRYHLWDGQERHSGSNAPELHRTSEMTFSPFDELNSLGPLLKASGAFTKVKRGDDSINFTAETHWVTYTSLSLSVKPERIGDAMSALVAAKNKVMQDSAQVEGAYRQVENNVKAINLHESQMNAPGVKTGCEVVKSWGPDASGEGCAEGKEFSLRFKGYKIAGQQSCYFTREQADIALSQAMICRSHTLPFLRSCHVYPPGMNHLPNTSKTCDRAQWHMVAPLSGDNKEDCVNSVDESLGFFLYKPDNCK